MNAVLFHDFMSSVLLLLMLLNPFLLMGRVTALVIGTISVEMIMQGLKAWLIHFNG